KRSKMKSIASTPSRREIRGSLRRLLIWVLILTAWETAYRLIGWRAYVFPAPSHLLDATLGLLNIDTGFSEALHQGWPKPTGILPTTHAPLVRRVLTSPLVTADLV